MTDMLDELAKPKRKQKRGRTSSPADAELPAAPKKASKMRRVVLVCSPKGGTSKTSTVRSLAVAATQIGGLNVATLDLDQQRTLTKWWGRRPDGVVCQFDHHEGLLSNLDDALSGLDDYDLVIIDTPPSLEENPVAIRRLVGLADLVLVPTGQYSDDLESVIPWMRLLSKYQKPCAFVLSKVKRRTNALDDARIRLNAAGAGRLCPIVIHDREEIPAAFSRGLTVLDIDRAKGADELEGLWLFTKAELGI